MTSRLRGPSAVKDTPRAAPFAKDHFHRSEPEVHSGRSCKNGGRGNRYHFGMSKQHDSKVERNGREYNKNFAQTEENNADLLYKKSRDHFGTWEIKDIVQDDARKSRKQDPEDAQLTNGKFRSEPVGAKLQDKSHDRPEYRDEGYVGSLPRENRQKGESGDLNGSHKSRTKESWEEEVESRNRGRTSKINRGNNDSNNDSTQSVDERDILLKEIENLATDGSQSPDRRIQAMIERLKSREESKLRSKREQRSASPEKEIHGTAKGDVARSDLRSPIIIDYSHDNLSNDRDRKLKDEEPRRSSESKLRGKSDREEDAVRRDRSTDRKSRSTERRHEARAPRRDDSFRKTSVERNYRGRSIEDEENHPRSRDNSSKRRSYTYEGSPEDFDVRIQKYDRALLEPRRDLDRSSPRRSSSREPNLVRKESLKEHDREPLMKKNSFKAESKRATSKDRGESNLARKTSFKDRDNDAYKKHVSKNQHESSIRYFGKDQEDLSYKDSFKDVNAENRKGFFKVRDDEFDRTFLKDQNDNAERKVSSMEHAGGVSRIVLGNIDDESRRSSSLKNANEDSGKKNSFKEKNVEFGEVSYKDRESNAERRKNSFKNDDKEFGRTSYHDYENNIDRKTANDRYIEFGKVSFKTQDDELRVSSPFKAEDNEAVVRTDSFKERDASPKRRATSLRSRDREALERQSDRHSRALSPPKKDEPENNVKNSKNFCAKAWYESNRMFSTKYLRDHSKLRSTPDGRVDVSPERGFLIMQDTRGGIVETSANDPEETRGFETRGRIDSGDSESPRFSSTRDRNGATIIRIRSSEDSGGAVERRRRRRPAQEICAVRRRKYEDDYEDSDEDEEKDRWRRTRRDGGILPGRSGGGGDAGGATPSRRVWNYREGVWHFHESIAFDRSFMVQRREAIFINRWRR